MLITAPSWPLMDDQTLPAAVALLARKSTGDEHIFCSGVPIRRDLILTAAHCIQQFKQHWQGYALAVRSSPRSDTTVAAKRWVVHPLFRQTISHQTLDVDVALLELEGALSRAENESADRPRHIHTPSQTLWMKGYSPIRLKTDTAERTMTSQQVWNQLTFERELIREGKFQLRAEAPGSAPCAGDSGAPLWSFEKQSRQLKAVVVQGNCLGGKANAVPVQLLSSWIQETLLLFSEYRSAAQELWKIFPQRLFAAGHN